MVDSAPAPWRTQQIVFTSATELDRFPQNKPYNFTNVFQHIEDFTPIDSMALCDLYISPSGTPAVTSVVASGYTNTKNLRLTGHVSGTSLDLLTATYWTSTGLSVTSSDVFPSDLLESVVGMAPNDALEVLNTRFNSDFVKNLFTPPAMSFSAGVGSDVFLIEHITNDLVKTAGYHTASYDMSGTSLFESHYERDRTIDPGEMPYALHINRTNYPSLSTDTPPALTQDSEIQFSGVSESTFTLQIHLNDGSMVPKTWRFRASGSATNSSLPTCFNPNSQVDSNYQFADDMVIHWRPNWAGAHGEFWTFTPDPHGGISPNPHLSNENLIAFSFINPNPFPVDLPPLKKRRNFFTSNNTKQRVSPYLPKAIPDTSSHWLQIYCDLLSDDRFAGGHSAPLLYFLNYDPSVEYEHVTIPLQSFVYKFVKEKRVNAINFTLYDGSGNIPAKLLQNVIVTLRVRFF